ncbi:MAG TPA: xanthine dehydrogenase family protein molybdopterin-binding subunit [Acidobacteriota bacterium]|nr:xanthine dehydrogenase family protein molybdopterin-binding subunit [Acidobacteriota bacterium]
MNEDMKKISEQMDNMRSDLYPLDEYRYIGKRGVRRLDGYEKAGGRALYTIDLKLQGMLYAKFLTSPCAHAKIRRMDTGRAEAYPGVRAVLRYDDPELPATANLGGHVPNEIVVLPEIAYFQGEEVGAVVAADTEDIADEALRLIEVEWEERPFILDVEAAKRKDAPPANPEAFPGGNHFNEGFLDVECHGDVEKGFAEADRIIEFKAERILTTWIGPERPCGVFSWNGEYPEVWLKHQHPQVGKRAISSWFGGIPMNRIQLHCLYQGASFGGWSHVSWNMAPCYCAGLLARRTGRPVKWLFNRREDFYGGEMDEGSYVIKVGAKNDGTITAVAGKAMMANQWFPVFGAFHHLCENTKIPNVHGKLEAIQVNKGPNVPTRCEQNANCMTLTLVFDRVAAELGLDPIEVALKNDGAEGHDMAWLNERKAEMGFPVRDSLRECIEKGKAAVDWDRNRHSPGTKRLSNGRMHGLAFTWTHEWEDSAGTGEIAIRIERTDGTASILAMRCDIGVNAETAYCQIAADELGMKVEDVFYRPHIDPGFFTMTPDSSTNMSVNGFAVRNAARILRRRILEVATRPLGATSRGSFPPAFPGMTPEDLDIKDSVIFVKKDPSIRKTIAQLVMPMGYEGPLAFTSEMGRGAERSTFSEPLFAYGWQVQHGAYASKRYRLCRQAHFMEVEVDTETGEVDVTRVVNVNDVGRVISWEGCEGQQYGGSYMAVGRGRSEEVIYDPATGVMLNGNLLDYKIATIRDIGSVDTFLVETGMGYGPYGVVGIAEDIATVVPALIVPAVYNATGKWVETYPVTPARVLEALGKA